MLPEAYIMTILRRFSCCSSSLFVRLWFRMWGCLYMFFICPSFGASGGLCFVIVALPVYLHIFFKHNYMSTEYTELGICICNIQSECVLLALCKSVSAIYIFRPPRWLSWMRDRLGIRWLRVRPSPGLQHSFVEI